MVAFATILIFQVRFRIVLPGAGCDGIADAFFLVFLRVVVRVAMPVREGSAMGSEDSQATGTGGSGQGEGERDAAPGEGDEDRMARDEGMVTAMSG